MLGAEFFNHHQVQRYLVAFGSFFNDLQISREDATGKEIQRIVVPLEYGNKEQWEVRLVQDPQFLKSTGVVTPRMAFSLTATTYDYARKQNSIDLLTYPTSLQQNRSRLYVGVPWILTFTLDILTKTQQDGLQILEQILPFFTPDLTFRLTPIEELGLFDQVPLTLTSLTHTDNFDQTWIERRAIIWTLTFSMKVNFYGPVKVASRIQEVIIDLYNSPVAALLDPVVIATEDEASLNIELEQGGHLIDENTQDTLLTLKPVSVITATANASGGVTTTVTDNVDKGV